MWGPVDGRFVVGRPRADIVVLDIDGMINVFDPETSELLVLNQTASAVWLLCDGVRTVEGVVAELVESYGASLAVVGPDVASTVRDLTERGLIVAGPGLLRATT